MEPINRSGWLSISEAADYLNLSQSFIRKQVRHQGIPFARPGGKVLRFRRSDLDHWLDSTNTSAAENDTQEQPNQLDYSRRLLQVLGWPALNSNLVLVRAAILALAKKHGGSQSRAFHHLRDCVLASQAEAVPINSGYLRALAGQDTEAH